MQKKIRILAGIFYLATFCGMYSPVLAQNLASAEMYKLYSQQDQAAVKANSLKTVLHQLEDQYKITFGFMDKTVENKFVDTQNLEGSNLEDILKKMLEPLELNYKKIDQNFYIIQPSSKSKKEVKKINSIKVESENQRINSGTSNMKSGIPFRLRNIQHRLQMRDVVVRGRVTAQEDGQPVPGVNVVVKGTTIGATTDANGEYTLSVADETVTLVFSFIGYTTQEVPLNGRAVVDVVLDTDVQQLNEVVVIGYQTVQKRDLTGAVAVVNSSDAKRLTANTVAESIQGLAAGVTVRNTGAPGASARIDIRGTGTFGQNQPLYVIDGMLSNATPDFNPNDIESIQILKDASAAAIYGSRAANGVIIITTRKGKEGPMQVTGNLKMGLQQFPKKWDLMNNREFAAMNTLAYTNVGRTPQGSVSSEFDPNVNTDWQDAVMRTGNTQDYNLTLSGGSATATYLISGNYFRNKGAIIGTSFDRANLRLNTTGGRGRFSFGQFLLLSYTQQDLMEGNPLIDMVRMLPTMPIQGERYIADNNPEGWAIGDENFANTFGTNPVALQRLSQRDQYNYRVRGNAFLEFKILEGLSYKFNTGIETSFDHFKGFRRPGVVRRGTPNVVPTADENRAQFLSLLFEHTINFNRDFGRHKVSAVAGISNQTFKYEQLFGQKQNLLYNTGTDEYYTVLNQGQVPVVGSYINKWANLGYLGRINYNYADKYLVSGTIRIDADTRFGEDYRWGTFPSISAAWRISKEGFFDAPWMSELKIRASYGELGNSEILQPWQYLARINPFPRAVFGRDESIYPGAINTTLANPDLRWETKTTTNIGLDASFLDNKWSVTAEYFIAKTIDVLTNLPIALTTGNAGDPPPVNAASLQNTGFEFTTTYRERANLFKWDISLNLTTIKNEVLELGDLGAGRNYIQLGDARTEVGRAIGEWYVLKTDGIFQDEAEVAEHQIQPWSKPGDIRYLNIDDDEGDLNVDTDRTYAGSPWPKLQGGLIWNASFKNFTFAMQWYGVFGNKLYNRARFWTDRFDENANYRAGINPWTAENPNSSTPRIGIDAGDRGIQFNARPDTDRWLESGSYVRLRNLEIGYTIPSDVLGRIGFNSAGISISGQNLLTFTKYTGLDPDVAGVNIFERGLDDGQYPSLRIYSIGLQFGF